MYSAWEILTYNSVMMKKVITIITALLCMVFVETNAQTLQVKSFTKAERDLAARTNPHKDVNGYDCALLKVQLAMDDASFGGGMIAHIEHKISEYWVYMSPGAQKINITLRGFLPLEVVFADYNCPKLQSKETYILTIESPSLGGQSNQLQRVVFNISPSDAGAKLFINNLNYDVVNGRYEIPLGVGSHTYRVEAKYYKTETGTLILDGTSESKTVDVHLHQHFGGVEVSSEPIGADVILNGKVQGQTPCKFPLIAGHHSLQIAKKGYKTKSVDVEIVDDKIVQLNEKLSTLIDVKITTKPTNARVSINGNDAGYAPCNIQQPAGKYDVSLTAKGYYDQNKTITIDGSKTTFNFNMKRVFFKPNGGYIEGNVQVGSFMAFGGTFGLYFSNVNIEASYLAGMSESDEIFWNSAAASGAQRPTSYTYKPTTIGGKVGYGVLFSNSIRFTPQVGISVTSLKGTPKNLGESTGVEKTYVSTAAVGARLHIALAQNFGISVAPEYSFELAKGKAFESMADASTKIKDLSGGFNCKIGLNIFF